MSKFTNITSLLIIFCIVFAIITTGCWDGNQPEDLVYVICMGLDKGTQNKIKLTFLVAAPKDMSKESRGDLKSSQQKGGGNNKDGNIIIIEARTITSGIKMSDEFMGKRSSLSHLQAIVMSEEFAKGSEGGIGVHLNFFNRYREIRGTTSIIVARKSSASDFISMLQPMFEPNITGYIESIGRLYKVSSNIPRADFNNFYRCAKSYDEQPIAMIASINKSATNTSNGEATKNSEEKENKNSIRNEGDYLAGDVPRASGQKEEFAGTAIFNGDKMVGEFDGIETSMMMYIKGESPQMFYSIEDPLCKGQYIIIRLQQRRVPRILATRQGNKCNINITLRLQGDILAIQSGINYESDQYMSKLKKCMQDSISDISNKTIKKAQIEYNADVFKLGHHLRKTFKTQQQWRDFNWKSKFSDANINLKTDLRIQHTGLMHKSKPIINNKKEIYYGVD